MWRFLPNVFNEVGGGSKPQQPQFVQPPPPQIIQGPQPNIAETSGQLAQSQLQYNPQLTAQQVQLQGQFGPQLAQQQFDIQRQFGPLYRALYEQQFPTQTQGLETLAQQANQRLVNPFSLTPQQQTAQDFFRQRAADELSRNVRSQANLGGNLYSGAREDRETRAQAELQNQFAQQDIQNQYQQRGQTLQELIAANQVLFPQITQPGVPSFATGVTPSPDSLMQAIQQSYLVNPAQFQAGTPGQPSMFGSFVQGYRGI